MYTSLFYKEWIKTRRPLLLLSAVFAATVAYILLNVAKLYQANPVALWEFIVQNNAAQAGYLKYLTLGAGIALALVQLAPEMQNKRLKLTLHLPLNESKIVGSILWFGIVALTGLYLASGAILLAGLTVYFPAEIVSANLLAMLPWMLGGLAAYLFAAWICLEPVWRQRVLYTIPALGCTSLFYLDALPGAYLPFVPWLASLTVAGFAFPFYSAIRFKQGVQ
ncbi:MAG: hypothetical protein LBT48_07730 [Prevotellaceae bacterium]|jgi:hypothetical protein|nr:hypothetical protein [Prevotellaceae bacterium]